MGYLCKKVYFCRLQNNLVFLHGGWYFLQNRVFLIAQVTNFMKLGYFAHIAYLLMYMQKIFFIITNANPLIQWHDNHLPLQLLHNLASMVIKLYIGVKIEANHESNLIAYFISYLSQGNFIANSSTCVSTNYHLAWNTH